ncbi:hypothetical protein EVAR_38003_1 [Eumeta japonica]|uniref:Uncharacterized protein n=1 Tax=Eumeta variegata TaxID=151549 RepID=A0A4C1WW35_EUMVA|nr:hypothetical protein EVAR_38003_1 [Eumeta japonica]
MDGGGRVAAGTRITRRNATVKVATSRLHSIRAWRFTSRVAFCAAGELATSELTESVRTAPVGKICKNIINELRHYRGSVISVERPAPSTRTKITTTSRDESLRSQEKSSREKAFYTKLVTFSFVVMKTGVTNVAPFLFAPGKICGILSL